MTNGMPKAILSRKRMVGQSYNFAPQVLSTFQLPKRVAIHDATLPTANRRLAWSSA